MKKYIPVIVLAGIWQIAALHLNVSYLPTLDAIFVSLCQYIKTQLAIDLASSFGRYSSGLGFGVFFAIVVGFLMAINKTIDSSLAFIVNTIRVIPSSALIPVVLMVFGFTDAAAICLIAFSAFSPLVKLVYDEVLLSKIKYQALVHHLELSPLTAIRAVYLPSILPQVLTGIDQSIIFSYRTLVVAEMFGVVSGIGYRLAYSAETLAHSKVYAVLFCLAAISFLVSVGYARLRKKVLVWL